VDPNPAGTGSCRNAMIAELLATTIPMDRRGANMPFLRDPVRWQTNKQIAQCMRRYVLGISSSSLDASYLRTLCGPSGTAWSALLPKCLPSMRIPQAGHRRSLKTRSSFIGQTVLPVSVPRMSYLPWLPDSHPSPPSASCHAYPGSSIRDTQ